MKSNNFETDVDTESEDSEKSTKNDATNELLKKVHDMLNRPHHYDPDWE